MDFAVISGHDLTMNNPFFNGGSVVPVSLERWMRWASDPDATRHVVLPMIQRGSVWAPHKLLDLWDTLLRGMPIGAMMASEAVGGSSVKEIGKGDTRESTLGDISLIDGQQRTLSMLAGWPGGLKNPLHPVAIWVDVTDDAQGEYLFRLWATTKAQPFGYARAGLGGQPLNKLERHKLRLANQVWGKREAQGLWENSDFMPWEAKFALPLTKLIAHEKEGSLLNFSLDRLAYFQEQYSTRQSDGASSQEAEIASYYERKSRALPSKEELEKRIPALSAALNKVFNCEFPVIHVRKEILDGEETGSSETDTDPPLAILFKRVGTGGEPLSNADYVYAVIKHHAPEVHDTVEELLKDERIRAIYTPTSLVMSAVRITMLSLEHEDGKGQRHVDSARLDKAAFARLVRNHPEFIDRFKTDIKPGGAFSTCLENVLNSMSYSDGFTVGLPKHALCLVPIPLLETILAWYTMNPFAAKMLEGSGLPMVRFALQGHLCVLDYAKASEMAIKAMRERKDSASGIFPDQELMTVLISGEKPVAHPLPSPKTLRDITGLVESPDGTEGLRGWTRFAVEGDENKRHAEVYKRWWNRKGGHVHPMLLWLQREYVRKFEKEPALAGMDEETLFDYDHILPSAQWAYWHRTESNKFLDYLCKDEEGKAVDGTGHWYIGNSIGNIHVLESSKNREIGDMSVRKKLGIEHFAINALIPDPSKDGCWQDASGEDGYPRKWDRDRALAFQRAVEQRTFALYSKFYADLFEAKS